MSAAERAMTDGVTDSDDGPHETTPAGVPRQGRRLSDKILVAFHHACDQGDFEVAEQLLQVVELMVRRRITGADPNRRRSLDSLVAAHERLWHLRNRDGNPA
jgi:hypothetical protein